MSQHKIYKITSIGRPLDPSWPSNKAVLILLPFAALAGLAWSLYAGETVTAAMVQGLTFALASFACWALGRELLPDDQVAAFVAMAFGFLTCLLASPGLLIPFITLGLIRIVNRSTGLPPRTGDSVILTLLVIWAVYATQSPWFAAVAALAFVLDASLKIPQRKQWWFALLCLGAMTVYLVDHDVPVVHIQVPDSLLEWLTIMALVLFSLNLLLLKKVHSRGDADHARLDIDRVKGGMAIGILCALQGLHTVYDVVLLVSTIGGLCLGIAFRRAFRSPAKGLRAG